MMTKFFTIKTCEPIDEQPVLIKIKTTYEWETPYYVCIAKHSDWGQWQFEEATGERYSRWTEDEIIGWMPLYALNDIEVE